jgi:UDP-GlcNAc:undecaprenyl-phosphate/decaprenyl-phosphate GlcNAc-1-phosphate transferase
VSALTAYLGVFAAAAGTTFLLTPVVRLVSVATGTIDQPSDRRVHPVPTPTAGGVAMYAGFVVALAVSRFQPFFADVNRASPEPLAALVTCSMMLLLGLIDDRRGVLWLTKLTGQVFVAGILVLMGVQLAYFVGGFGGRDAVVIVLTGDLPAMLTIAWVIVVANAVNLVDGLDGLAAGMVAIAMAAFFVFMVQSTSLFGTASQAALLSSITCGICLGFLPWNFHRAKIFMGDSGAMLLGMLVSIATISGVGRNPYPPSPGDLAVTAIPLLVVALVLFVPFLDVVLAIVRRTRRGVGIGHADKEHLHHRLLEIGHGHRRAVLLMYLWSALIAGSGLAIGLIDGRLIVGLILVSAAGLFVATALPRLANRRNGNGGSGGGAAAAGLDPAPAVRPH